MDVREDHATMIARLSEQIPADVLALALGIRRRELDEIAAGYAPHDRVAKRLDAMWTAYENGRLEPVVTMAEAARRGSMVPLAALPLVRKLFVGFIVCDALLFGAAALFFAFR